ncbi:hypothetical protein EsH8_IX_001074 [Colletotrichum jinshuiense]
MLAILRQIDRPVIDMGALAEDIGAASANAARMRISAATNKHGWFSHAAITGDSGTPVIPLRRKGAGPISGQKNKARGDERQHDETETPLKKKPSAIQAKAKVKADSVEEAPAQQMQGDDVQDDDITITEAAGENQEL